MPAEAIDINRNELGATGAEMVEEAGFLAKLFPDDWECDTL
jgi:hypothetical protein